MESEVNWEKTLLNTFGSSSHNAEIFRLWYFCHVSVRKSPGLEPALGVSAPLSPELRATGTHRQPLLQVVAHSLHVGFVGLALLCHQLSRLGTQEGPSVTVKQGEQDSFKQQR